MFFGGIWSDAITKTNSSVKLLQWWANFSAGEVVKCVRGRAGAAADGWDVLVTPPTILKNVSWDILEKY